MTRFQKSLLLVGLLAIITGAALLSAGSISREAQTVKTVSFTKTLMVEATEQRFVTIMYTTSGTYTSWVGGLDAWRSLELRPWSYSLFILYCKEGDSIKGSILIDPNQPLLEFSLMDRETYDDFRKAKYLYEQENLRARAIINIRGPNLHRYYEFVGEGYKYDFKVKVKHEDTYYALIFNDQETRYAKAQYKFYVESERPRIIEATQTIYITTTRPTIIEWVGTITESRAGLDNPQTYSGILALVLGIAILGATLLRRGPPEGEKLTIGRGMEARPSAVALNEYECKLKEYEEKLSKLHDALATGKISLKIFETLKEEYEAKIDETKRRIASAGPG